MVQPNPSTAPNQAGPICFRCCKAGHLSHDCKLGKPRVVAAHVAEDEEAIPNEDGPEGEDQEEEALVNGVEQEDAPLEGNQYLDKLVEDNETQSCPYPWDNELGQQVHPVVLSMYKDGSHPYLQLEIRMGGRK